KNEKRIKDLEGWESDSTPDYKEYGSDDDYLNEALKDKVPSRCIAHRRSPSLKEPRALFSGAQDAGLQPAKWPIEMEVLPDRVLHVDCPPEAAGAVWQLGERGGLDLYRTSKLARLPTGCQKQFIKSEPVAVGLSASAKSGTRQSDDSLVFESRFESGNLRRAYRVARQAYRFTLVNFYKSASLYNEGLRPLMYSCRASEVARRRLEKMRLRHQVLQEQPAVTTPPPTARRKFYYSLTWQTRFEFPDDTVYFAPLLSYTYSTCWTTCSRCSRPGCVRLLQAAGPLPLLGWQRRSPALTIGTPEEPPKGGAKTAAAAVEKAGHPGDVPGVRDGQSDRMMERVLWGRKRADDEANKAAVNVAHMEADDGGGQGAEKGQIRINPDGQVGNYRCSLAGRDLNRELPSPLRDSFPAVCAIVDLVSACRPGGPVALYCDLHGHSRRQNVHVRLRPDKRSACSERVFRHDERECAGTNESSDSCKFRIAEEQGGHRAQSLGIRCAYTMEATFCALHLGGPGGFHFTAAPGTDGAQPVCDSTGVLILFDPTLRAAARAIRPSSMRPPTCLTSSRRDGSAADDPEECRTACRRIEFSGKRGRPSRECRGLGASGRRKKRRSRKELAAADAGRRRAASSLKEHTVTCASPLARATHSQQPTAYKWSPSAPGRPAKVSASKQANRLGACHHYGDKHQNDYRANSHKRGRIRKRLLENSLLFISPSHLDQLFKTATAAASAAVSVGTVPSRHRTLLQQQQQQQQQQPPQPPRNSSETLGAGRMRSSRAAAAAADGHKAGLHRLLEQSRPAQNDALGGRPILKINFPTSLILSRTSLTDQPLGPASALSRAVSLDESNSRIGGRRFKGSRGDGGLGRRCGPAGSRSAGPAWVLQASADSNSLTPASWHQTRVRMRHRFAGHRVGPPDRRHPRHLGPRARSEASVPNSVAQTATNNNGDDKLRSLVAATPDPALFCQQPRQPRRWQKLQQVASRLLSLRPFDQVTSPSQPQSSCCQTEWSREVPRRSSSNQRLSSSGTLKPVAPEVAADGPGIVNGRDHQDDHGVEGHTAEASSCSENRPSSHSSRSSTASARAKSVATAASGQEIAQTFSQPTVVAQQRQQATCAAARLRPEQRLLVPRLPVGGRAARRLSQFRATDAATSMTGQALEAIEF
uniref:Ig-like domain-containing protein n=1 Tax=Macrostomum lignano TaxID=282301 RepID=A0A1I8JRW0_9PLAT